jgi:hypothetical protein
VHGEKFRKPLPSVAKWAPSLLPSAVALRWALLACNKHNGIMTVAQAANPIITDVLREVCSQWILHQTLEISVFITDTKLIYAASFVKGNGLCQFFCDWQWAFSHPLCCVCPCELCLMYTLVKVIIT